MLVYVYECVCMYVCVCVCGVCVCLPCTGIWKAWSWIVAQIFLLVKFPQCSEFAHHHILAGSPGGAGAAEAVDSGISGAGRVYFGDSLSAPLWMAAGRQLLQACPEPQHHHAAKSCTPEWEALRVRGDTCSQKQAHGGVCRGDVAAWEPVLPGPSPLLTSTPSTSERSHSPEPPAAPSPPRWPARRGVYTLHRLSFSGSAQQIHQPFGFSRFPSSSLTVEHLWSDSMNKAQGSLRVSGLSGGIYS